MKSRFNCPLKASLLAVALALALPLSAAEPVVITEVNLRPGPLGLALSTFASQRGIALSFDPALTDGLQAPALKGSFTNREGLERLIAGSGLSLAARADGSYLLVRKESDSGVIRIGTLRVPGTDAGVAYAGGLRLGADYIADTNRGNGDLATLLRLHPGVQFDDSSLTSSRQAGEIRPADFSIHGALPYQNLLLLDGVGFNNDLDPGATFNPHVEDVPSPSQGVAVDTDLLGSLTVYDSNVPAAFGGFTGGVVDARTRRAADTLGGKAWFRMSRSAWNELIVPKGNQIAFDQSSLWTNQPRYDKYKAGFTLEGRLDNGIGLIGSVTQTRSDIPLRAYSNNRTSPNDAFTKTQKRENTSFMLRADWAPTERIDASAHVNYAPSDNRYFVQNAKNSEFDLRFGGPMAGLRIVYSADVWTFDNQLGYSDLESSRRTDLDIPLKAWARSEAFDWGVDNTSMEGNLGDLDQSTRTAEYKLVANREVWQLGPTEHRLQFGMELRDRKAEYDRSQSQMRYMTPRATMSCVGPNGVIDSEACSLSPVFTSTFSGRNPVLIAGQGQYFSTLTVMGAGRFEVGVREYSAFVEDEVRLGRFKLRAGLRFDSDDMMDNNTIAPRFAASWDVFGSQNTLLTAGANRYYGRNFFNQKLREGRENLMTDYIRSSVAKDWTKTWAYTSTNRFEQLDIPYADELMFGINQSWPLVAVELKYVQREGRDEILRESVESNDDTGFFSSRVFQYVNRGRSSSETFSLTARLQQPWQWGPAATQAYVSLDHTDTRRNYANYDTTYNSGTYNRPVRFEGEIIRAHELPQARFNRPWTARLSTQTHFDDWGLTWSNFARWRAGYVSYATIGKESYQNQQIDVIEQRENPSGWSWDSTLEYAFKLPREQQAYARVEVQNVLNRSMLMTTSVTNTGALYEPGRSYWVEVGYRF